MAITFPLDLPAAPAAKQITITPQSVVAVSRSPFTGSQQVQRHPGQMWAAQVSMPPMLRPAAEEWIAFFLKLNGSDGTFLMGDPVGKMPRGRGQGSPTVNGAGQSGNELLTVGWDKPLDAATADSTLITADSREYTADQQAQIVLRVGDYIQLGTGTSSRLYKVLDDAERTDAATGAATLTVWPRLRPGVADGAAIVYSDCKGVFRMNSNAMPFDIGEAKIYGLGFQAVEAL